MSAARSTRQRRAIRATVAQEARPLSAGEIYRAARHRCPDLGLATVYRTIDLLLAKGWLQIVQLPGSGRRFEVAVRDHHHHFHCRRCDRAFDLLGCPGEVHELAPPGFVSEAHDITLYGLCATCAGY